MAKDVFGTDILVHREGDTIVVGPYPPIPLARCKDAEQLLGWINHLLDKSWMTTEIVKQFIRVAVSDCGIRIDYNT